MIVCWNEKQVRNNSGVHSYCVQKASFLEEIKKNLQSLRQFWGEDAKLMKKEKRRPPRSCRQQVATKTGF